MADLQPIPVVDIRSGGPLRHAREGEARARALRIACLKWFPLASRPIMPLLDLLTRRWLQRAGSPYVDEIRDVARHLRFPGIWFLNGSYQWCCTALAREEAGAPWLIRTLDWPFPGLGRYVEIAHMRGPAGDFYNVTWPGYVGVLTGLAPGRFAASINQAPMRRTTHGPFLRLYDIGRNAIETFASVRDLPPDQLLRQAFETCRSYRDARLLLETIPLARPVIFTLVGCARGERCVIERTERGGRTREYETSAANDWLLGDKAWEARVGASKLFSSTYDDAAANSRNRREALAGWQGRFADGGFAWVTPPVLNQFTRIAVEMCPANGVLRVLGFEVEKEGELPERATLPGEVRTERVAA